MKSLGELPRVVRAKDTKLFLEDGREIIDAISSWWVITHGHNHPLIVEAICQQTEKFGQVLFGNFSHAPAEELVDVLESLLPPTLKHYFFSDNGSTAVEVALKMALGATKNRGQHQRNRFISFANAYHGDTAGAMSVSGPSIFTENYREMTFPVVHAEVGGDDFKNKLERWGEEVVAVIFEPLIQGAGGMKLWPLPELQRAIKLAREMGALIIFDEVMTAFGRTGKNFAFEHLGIVPDILCLSKGLTGGVIPLALTVASADIYQSFLSPARDKMFFHGHSFTANPIACKVATISCSLMKESSLKEKWQKINRLHYRRMEKVQNHPLVSNGRICGTMVALELAEKNPGYQSSLAPIVTKRAMEEGVFLRPLGNVLYTLPPYCISEEELNQVWDTIELCLTEGLLNRATSA